MEKTNQKTQNLEVGQRVVAFCMGRKVGDYVVVSTGMVGAQLKVVGRENEERSLYGKRKYGADKQITITRGAPALQCVEFYALEASATLEELDRQLALTHAQISKARWEEEMEMLQNRLRELESQRAIVLEEIEELRSKQPVE